MISQTIRLATCAASVAIAATAQVPATADDATRAVASESPAPRPLQAPPAPRSALDQLANAYSVSKEPIQQSFFLIGRTYNVAFVVDPAITGDVTVDVPAGGTVKQLVEAITTPRDLFYEERDGHVLIKRDKMVFYELVAPGNTRTSSSQTSIALSSSSSGSLGANGAGGQPPLPTPAAGASGLAAGSGSTSGGQSNITVTERNENPFWELVTVDLQKNALASEKVMINPNSGLLIVTASPKRHREFYSGYVAITNEKLSRQVDIDAQILEVALNEQHQTGIDYSILNTRLGDARLNGATVNTNITSIGPAPLSPPTFSASLTAGKVNVLIRALQEQGEVRSIAKPQVRVMNNQTAYLVVGREQGFFTLSATQQITTPTTGTTASEAAVYTKETLTFGTIFSVTAAIPTPETTILDVKPERSTLVRIDTSPDQRQQTPVTDVQRAGTRLLLRSGETTVLAGLSNSTTGTAMRGAPGISKVPFLGALFRTDAKTSTKSELVIIITAKIQAAPASGALAAAGVSPK